MRKATVVVISLLCLALAFSLFVLVAGTQAKTQKALPVDEWANGKDLWEFLQKEHYAKNWKMYPGTKAFYPGKEPHGALLTTYVNDVAYNGIKGKQKTMPDESIIVKKNYTADKKLAALTVMQKLRKGYNPQAGNWFWVKYLPDGKIAAAGKVEACISCHAKAKATDYLFGAPQK
jgi:hypothetical protein